MGFLGKTKKKNHYCLEHCIWVKTHLGKLLWNYTFPKG